MHHRLERRYPSFACSSRSCRVVLLFLLATAIALSHAPGAHAEDAPPQSSQISRPGDRAAWTFSGSSAASADAIVAQWDGLLTQSVTEIELVLDLALPVEIPVSVIADAEAFAAAVAGELAQARAVQPAGVGAGLVIDAGAFGALSTTTAALALRHAVAHLAITQSTSGTAPPGFSEGLARYLERPASESIARDTALLQAAYQQGALPSWFDLNRYIASLDQELLAAQSYAVVAFLIERYDLGPLRQLLSELSTGATWTNALRAAYGRDPNALERQWREDLPRWLAVGWRSNIMAAFDLEPTRQHLERADYSAAKRALEPSLALMRQLRAPAFSAEVQELAERCDAGIQAESLMSQTHAALLERDYERADMLLTQADALYRALPGEQQPRSLIESWGQIARDGITAGERLQEAQRLSRRWADARAAQTAASEAGMIFAAIGDTEGALAAQAILDRLGERQMRFAIALIALAAIVAIWLMLWLWSRGPSELRWPTAAMGRIR